MFVVDPCPDFRVPSQGAFGQSKGPVLRYQVPSSACTLGFVDPLSASARLCEPITCAHPEDNVSCALKERWAVEGCHTTTMEWRGRHLRCRGHGLVTCQAISKMVHEERISRYEAGLSLVKRGCLCDRRSSRHNSRRQPPLHASLVTQVPFHNFPPSRNSPFTNFNLVRLRSDSFKHS